MEAPLSSSSSTPVVGRQSSSGSSSGHGRRSKQPVPMLLSSFPVPPSHVPSPSPTTVNIRPQPSPLLTGASLSPATTSIFSNPPLSPAPADPLPPLPSKPSSITERDTLSFISSSSRKRSLQSIRSTASSSHSTKYSVSSLGSAGSYDNSHHHYRHKNMVTSSSSRYVSPVSPVPEEARQQANSPALSEKLEELITDDVSELVASHRGSHHRRESLVDVDLNDLYAHMVSPELGSESGHGHPGQGRASVSSSRLQYRTRPRALSTKSATNSVASYRSTENISEFGSLENPSTPASQGTRSQVLRLQTPAGDEKQRRSTEVEDKDKRESASLLAPSLSRASMPPPTPASPQPASASSEGHLISKSVSSSPSGILGPGRQRSAHSTSFRSQASAGDPSTSAAVSNIPSRSTTPVSARIPPSTFRRPSTSSLKSSISSTTSAQPSSPPLPPLPMSARTSLTSVSFPKSSKMLTADSRSTSPDIQEIISSTPRPKRSSAGSSTRSRSASRLRQRSKSQSLKHARTRSGRSDYSAVSTGHGEGVRLSGVSATSSASKLSKPHSAAALTGSRPHSQRTVGSEGNDDNFSSYADTSIVSDYGDIVGRQEGGYDLGLVEDGEQFEDGDASDSGSSIDLHTPLPHIMLRAGVLSPHSKLLAHPPSSTVLGRPASIASNVSSASVMTKSGIYKDQRDTVQRRTRHRDGKLLRDGRGLTTGLGWSDSEDEGAPSELTHRLSTLAISRKSSLASLRLDHQSGEPKSQKPLRATRSVSAGLSLKGSRSLLPKIPMQFSAPGRPLAHPLSRSTSASVIDVEAKINESESAEVPSTVNKAATMTRVINYSYPLSPHPGSPELKSISLPGAIPRSMTLNSITSVSSTSNSSPFHSPSFSTGTSSLRNSAGPTEEFIAKGVAIPSPSFSHGTNSAETLSPPGGLRIPNVRTENTSPTPSTSSTSSASIPPPVTPDDDRGRGRTHIAPSTPARGTDTDHSSLSPSDLNQDMREFGMRSKTPTAMDPRPPTTIATSGVWNRSPVGQSQSRSLNGIPQMTRMPSIGSTRPLQLPAIQKFKGTDEVKLQPGQPLPKPGQLLSYNRKLHDQQKALVASSPGSEGVNPPTSSLASRLGSTGKKLTGFGFRTPLSRPAVSSPTTPTSESASSGLRQPRTGTGMVYRKSSASPNAMAATVVNQMLARSGPVPIPVDGGKPIAF